MTIVKLEIILACISSAIRGNDTIRQTSLSISSGCELFAELNTSLRQHNLSWAQEVKDASTDSDLAESGDTADGKIGLELGIDSDMIAQESHSYLQELGKLKKYTVDNSFFLLLGFAFCGGMGVTACVFFFTFAHEVARSRALPDGPLGIEDTPGSDEDHGVREELQDMSLKIQTYVAKYPRAGIRATLHQPQHRFLAVVPVVASRETLAVVTEVASQQQGRLPTLDDWQKGSLAWWPSKSEFEDGIEPSGSVLLSSLAQVGRGQTKENNCDVRVRVRESSHDGASELVLRFPDPGSAEEWSANVRRFVKRLRENAAEDGYTLHVKGVKKGPHCEEELMLIFSQFGEVVQVTIREKVDEKTGADASWALVTMGSSNAVQSALELGVRERMDNTRPMTISLFSKKQAAKSTGAMSKVREAVSGKVNSSSWAQMTMNILDNDDDFEDRDDQEEHGNTRDTLPKIGRALTWSGPRRSFF